MEEPTAPMKKWAADAGTYDLPLKGSVHRTQILSIADILEGKKAIQLPSGSFLIAAEEAKQAREPKPKQEQLLPPKEVSVATAKPSRRRRTEKPQGIPPGQRVMVPVVGLPRSSDDAKGTDSEAGSPLTTRAAKKKRTA